MDLSIHQDIQNRFNVRLPSRKPFWLKLNEIGYETYTPDEDWKGQWNDLHVTNSYLIEDPNKEIRGFDLPRKTWTQINRIRSNHGRCNYTLNKWNPLISHECN